MKTIKQPDVKEKMCPFELENCCGNLIKTLNTWAFPLVKYSGPFLIIVRIFKDWQDSTTVNLHMASKGKPQQGNGISFNSSLK